MVLAASAVIVLGVLALGASQVLAQQAPHSQTPPAAPASPGSVAASTETTASLEKITVTSAYRPGQLLKTVPGLVVTVHSGEGKANQYLMRGYNLDHGTDLATFVDGIPVNEPSHAHGQGYTDLNFLIPELAGGLEYTKGTYYAAQGDFAGVGSVHIAYLNTIPDEVSVSGASHCGRQLDHRSGLGE